MLLKYASSAFVTIFFILSVSTILSELIPVIKKRRYLGIHPIVKKVEGDEKYTVYVLCNSQLVNSNNKEIYYSSKCLDLVRVTECIEYDLFGTPLGIFYEFDTVE